MALSKRRQSDRREHFPLAAHEPASPTARERRVARRRRLAKGGGAKYLSQLLTRFDGNVALALAGYNAGPAKVARYHGIPPYGQTRGYVTKIRTIVGANTGVFFPLPAKPVLRSAHTRAHVRHTRAGRSTPRLHHPRPSRRG